MLLAKHRKGELEERVKAGDSAERGKVQYLATLRITQPHPQLEVPLSRDTTQRPCHRRSASATSMNTAVHPVFILTRARAKHSLPESKHMRATPRVPKEGRTEASNHCEPGLNLHQSFVLCVRWFGLGLKVLALRCSDPYLVSVCQRP